MSKENVAALWKKAQTDPELRQRIEALPAGSGAEIVAGLAQLGSELGLPFTSEEFVQTAVIEGAQLSDQDLSTVAGGFNRLLSDRFSSQLSLQFAAFTFKMPDVFLK